MEISDLTEKQSTPKKKKDEPMRQSKLDDFVCDFSRQKTSFTDRLIVDYGTQEKARKKTSTIYDYDYYITKKTWKEKSGRYH